MSILTGLVIVVAMAVLAQRSDSLIGFITREEAPMISPQNDQAIVAAGDSQMIDVLANDENVAEEDAGNLRIVVSPSCGAAEATDAGVLYISNNQCVGPQLFAYCVGRGDECPSASVTVVVADDPALVVAAGREKAREAEARAAAAREAAAREADKRRAEALAANAAKRATGQSSAGSEAAVETARAEAPKAPTETQEDIAVGHTVAASVRPVSQSEIGVGDFAAAPRIDLTSLSESGAASGDGATPRIAGASAAADATKLAALDPSPRLDAGLSGVPRPATLFPKIPTAPARTSAPDVAAIRALSDDASVDVAALEPSTDDATLLRMRRAAAEDEREATEDDGAAERPVAAASCGPIEASSKASVGGASLLTVASPCRAGEPIEILHADLRFSGLLDAAGDVSIVLPVMDESGAAEIVARDGASVAHELRFNWRELEMTRRIAVAWTDAVDLDLHAFEYAADFGDEGHVWQDSPRGFRLVRRSDGGYLDTFEAAFDGAQTIEVYTFWANSRARRGVARIALDHASRGASPSGDYCGEGAFASPRYEVVRSERGVVTAKSRGRFAAVTCGASLTGEARYASDALRDLEIE